MLFKTTLVASAAAIALTLAPAALGAPTPSGPFEQNQRLKYCYKIGSGQLGVPNNGIPPYTQDVPMQPNSVKSSEDTTLITGQLNPTIFDFHSCDGGSTTQPQGFIQAPNGQCVTVLGADGDFNRGLRTTDCVYNMDQFRGGVAASQHFQFEKSNFADAFIVNFASHQGQYVDPDHTNLWSVLPGGAVAVNNYICGPHFQCEGQHALYAPL